LRLHKKWFIHWQILLSAPPFASASPLWLVVSDRFDGGRGWFKIQRTLRGDALTLEHL